LGKKIFGSVCVNHLDYPNMPDNVFSITPSLQKSITPEVHFQSPLRRQIKACPLGQRSLLYLTSIRVPLPITIVSNTSSRLTNIKNIAIEAAMGILV
jgi:hypothetical protein